MKKLLCVVAVIALVLALAAPAFASDGIPVAPTKSAENQGGNNEPAKTVTPGAPAGPAAPKSPATGYNTVLWILAAAAMTVCAGYCFSTSKKSFT